MAAEARRLEHGWRMTDGSYICDGCNVNGVHEHRCHGADGGPQCDCPECRPISKGDRVGVVGTFQYAQPGVSETVLAADDGLAIIVGGASHHLKRVPRELVEVSPELSEQLSQDWSEPVQVMIQDGQLIFRNVGRPVATLPSPGDPPC